MLLRIRPGRRFVPVPNEGTVENCASPDVAERLAASELVVESGLEGVVTWLLRILGLVAIVAGIGLWMFTGMGPRWACWRFPCC